MLRGGARLAKMVAVVGVVAAFAVGCGDANPLGGGGGGSIGEDYDLSGTELTVGSKEFTEQEILGQISLQALEAAGATVEDETGLTGSTTVRESMLSGEVDMYWEYVGTAWVTYLDETGDIPGESDFETVAERDLEENDVEWFAPAPFENSYGIATNQETAEEYDLQALSDIGRVIEENPEEATMCGGSEFLGRDDGLPGVEEEYGWEFPDDQVTQVQDSIVYNSVAEGEDCNFGAIFTTDGRIQNLDLAVLEDDEGFFPSYAGAMTTRSEVLEENEQVAEIFEPIAEELDTETMRSLNAQVDVDSEFPDDVAEEWLQENDFIG